MASKMSEEPLRQHDLDVASRLGVIEAHLSNQREFMKSLDAKLPEIWKKVGEHDRAIERGKTFFTVLSSLWGIVVAVIAKRIASHGW